MFVDEKPNPRSGDLYEDVSREDIVSAFRSAMIGHFRSHVPGTNINESTLLASDYLNHFHELVMLFEAISSEPKGFTDDLMSWRPLTYEEHFAESGFRDKNLAIAAYRRAPQKIRARFDEAVARLHGEAVTLVVEVGTERRPSGCASSSTRPTPSPTAKRCQTGRIRNSSVMSAARPRSTPCSARAD